MNETQVTLDAEHALVGALLVDERCLALLPPTLQAQDFQSDVCRVIYEAIRSLEARGEKLDPVQVRQETERMGKPVPGNVLMELMELTPTCENVAVYARNVHQNKLHRVTREILHDLSEDSTTPLEELIGKARTAVDNLDSHAALASGSGGVMAASECAFEQPKWLIEPYFPIGKGTLIQANPGTGKTAFMCAVAAAVSTGRSILGAKVQTPGNVLLLSTEDDLPVLRGRLEASGGDVRRIFFLKHTENLTFNSPVIEQAIKKRNIKLLIFDPFQAFLGQKVDMFRANETRPVLAQLFEMCARNDCACAIVAHLSKTTLGKSPVLQSLGSGDIPASMRSILHIVRNPEMKEEVMAVHVKSSNSAPGKAITYTIGDRGGVRWIKLRDFGLEELEDMINKRKKQDPATPYEQEPLVQVMRALVKDRPEGGYWSYDEVKAISVRVLGYPLFDNPRNLRSRFPGSLYQRIEETDGIEVFLGSRTMDSRGITIHRKPPMTQ